MLEIEKVNILKSLKFLINSSLDMDLKKRKVKISAKKIAKWSIIKIKNLLLLGLILKIFLK